MPEIRVVLSQNNALRIAAQPATDPRGVRVITAQGNPVDLAPVFLRANSALLIANLAFDQSNVIFAVANTANARGNLAQMSSNAAYDLANTIKFIANLAYDKANSANLFAFGA